MKFLLILKETLIPALLGGIAIFLISFFLKITLGNVILLASLGASTVILSEFPNEKFAKLKVVIISYLFAALIGYGVSFIGNSHLAAGLGIFLITSVMLLTNNVHPPAGGVTLAFIFSPREPITLLYVMLSIIALLVILKSIIYIYKKELNIKKFHHEFIR